VNPMVPALDHADVMSPLAGAPGGARAGQSVSPDAASGPRGRVLPTGARGFRVAANPCDFFGPKRMPVH
jgi:hypothetical protein